MYVTAIFVIFAKNFVVMVAFLGYNFHINKSPLGIIMNKSSAPFIIFAVVVAVLLSLAASVYRMQDCMAKESAFYCWSTQKGHVVWDMIFPLKKSN